MKKICSVVVMFSMVFSLSVPAFAVNGTWGNAGVVSPGWDSADNWSLGTAPGATSGTTNTDIATFNTSIGSNGYGTSGTPVVIDPGRNIGGINFDTAADSYYIGSTSGNSLLLTSGGTTQILDTLTTTNAIETINAPLVIEGSSGAYTFSNNSANGTGAGAGTLNIGGDITGGASGNTVLTLEGSNTNSNTISGIIANGSATSVGITKSGAGTWVLSGANTYTGATTVSAGTLQAGVVTQAFGVGSAVTVMGGATLDLGGLDETIGSLAGAGTVSSSAAGTPTLTVGSNNSSTGFSGTIQNGSATSVGLTQEGSGTLILSGANTYTGVTTLDAGTINLGVAEIAGVSGPLGASAANNPGSIVLNGGYLQYSTLNQYDYSGRFSTADNQQYNVDTNGQSVIWNTALTSSGGALTKIGSGTLTLSGANTYDGGTTIDGGTLTVTGIGATLGATTGALSVNNTNTGAGTAVTLNLSTSAGTTTGSLSGTIAAPSSGTNTVTINNGGELFTVNQTVDGSYAGVIAGTGGFTLGSLSTNTLTLTGDNTYSGNTLVDAGILNIQNANALGNGAGSASVVSGATLQIQGGITTTAEALTLNGTGISNNGALENVSGDNTYAGLITLGSGTRINSDSGTLTLSNAGTISGSGDALAIGGAGNTIVDSIIGTGSGTLTKDGTGILTLTGANTYTGVTTLDAGTINLGVAEIVGVSGPLGASAANNPGSIVLNGGYLQYSTLNQHDYSGRFSTAADQQYNVDTNGQPVVWNTALTSSGGALTKIGSGTLTLSGANTYDGGTTIDGGTLTVGAGGTLGATTGALSVNNTNTGAGTAVTLNLSTSADTTTGSLSGTIAAPGSGTNTATINNVGELFTVNQTVDGNYAGVIAGSGSFALGNLSNNTLTLSGDNTYSGGTTINAGLLQVANSSALGIGAVVNDATLVLGTTSLSLGGAYTQNTNSALYLTAAAANFGSITTAVASSVAAGSMVSVTVMYDIPNNQVFKIINTEGAGLTGSAPSTVESSSSFISFLSSIVDSNLILTTDNPGLASLANNPNARAVGAAIDGISNASNSDMSNVIATLVNSSKTQISAALNTMGPVVDGGVAQNSSAALDNLVSATLDRIQNNLDHATSGNFSTGVSSGDESELDGIWAKPYGSYLTQGTLQGIQGYDAWNAGTIVGYDHMISDNFTLGVSGGYAYGQVDSDANDASTDITSAQGMIYAGYQDPNLNYYIDAAGSFAWDWYNGRRDISVDTINRTADADYNGQQYGIYLESGYKFNWGGNFKFTPLTSLQWTHLSLDNYTETNAGALDLDVDSQGYDILESGLGASISYPQEFNWGTFTPELHAKWLYDFINDKMVLTSSFTGGGGPFTSNGAAPAREGADIGGKLSFDLNNNFSLIAEADAELKDGFFGVYGSGTVHYKF